MSKTRPSVTSGIAFCCKNACDGKRSCKFIVSSKRGNPDPKCEESFSVKYQCGNAATHSSMLPNPKALKNRGIDCWQPCSKKSGKCEYCGTGNKCCRKGWEGVESSCSSSEGGNGYHTCISGHTKSTLNNRVLELRCTSDTLALVSSDIRGFDQDDMDAKLRYEIIGGNVMNTFEVDSVSGNLFAKVHRLDFEKMNKYFKIQIVDEWSSSSFVYRRN